MAEHKHTDECLNYAADTGKAFCIASCKDSRVTLEAKDKAIRDYASGLDLHCVDCASLETRGRTATSLGIDGNWYCDAHITDHLQEDEDEKAD